jgi:hypothetical protein
MDQAIDENDLLEIINDESQNFHMLFGPDGKVKYLNKFETEGVKEKHLNDGLSFQPTDSETELRKELQSEGEEQSKFQSQFYERKFN